MILKNFLSSLNTINIQVAVKDSDNELICKIYASSSSALSDDLAQRTIHSWSIVRANYIVIVLDEIEDDSPEQTNQDENSNENSNENFNENPNENSNEEENTES